ncbi:MAG: B12-binding domain-containing radical SAM protein [Deltaproteobacteria bacterium]
MNVVLAALNRNTIYTPLALLYLRACISRDRELAGKADVELKEFELSDSCEYIVWEIVRRAPGVVAFSCYLWNISLILRLSAMLKQVLPGAVIVLGGPEVSPRAHEIIAQNPAVDIVIRGEGEFAFVEAVKAIKAGKGLSGIKGLTFRMGRKVIENPERPPIKNLDSIPSVYLDGCTAVAHREACLETQRGCVFGCEFCYYNKGCRTWRKFGLARVRRELAFLLSQSDVTVYLMDPVFNIDLKRAKEICRFIIERNRHHAPFHTEIQAELVDAELASLLKKADMRYVEVGLQSVDKGVLGRARRPFDRERFVKGFNLLKDAGLVVELQLILGLPGDTLEKFKESLEFALRLDPPVLSVFKLQVLPGTGIRRDAARLGLKFDREPPYEFIESPTMPLADSIHCQKIVNSISLFRRDPSALACCRREGITLVGLIERWLRQMPSDGILLNGEDNRALAREARIFSRSLNIKRQNRRDTL